MSLGFPAEHFRLSSQSQSERSGCDRNTAERRTEGQSSEFKEQTHKTRQEEILEAGNTKRK